MMGCAVPFESQGLCHCDRAATRRAKPKWNQALPFCVSKERDSLEVDVSRNMRTYAARVT
ncbi:hypothetical protein PCAR4_810050 [Paraburkholderia caribensis]|nr:hypothetical protein PCAR4_810050 [Paraburkholderia caribensis]